MLKDKPYFEGFCHYGTFWVQPNWVCALWALLWLSFSSILPCLYFASLHVRVSASSPRQGSPEWSWATIRCTPSPAAWPSPSTGRTTACQWSASWTTQRSKTSRPRSTWRFSVSRERNLHFAAFPSSRRYIFSQASHQPLTRREEEGGNCSPVEKSVPFPLIKRHKFSASFFLLSLPTESGACDMCGVSLEGNHPCEQVVQEDRKKLDGGDTGEYSSTASN